MFTSVSSRHVVKTPTLSEATVLSLHSTASPVYSGVTVCCDRSLSRVNSSDLVFTFVLQEATGLTELTLMFAVGQVEVRGPTRRQSKANKAADSADTSGEGLRIMHAVLA